MSLGELYSYSGEVYFLYRRPMFPLGRKGRLLQDPLSQHHRSTESLWGSQLERKAASRSISPNLTACMMAISFRIFLSSLAAKLRRILGKNFCGTTNRGPGHL